MRTYCVAPVQPKAIPKRAAPKPRPTGKLYIQAQRDRRISACNQLKAQPKARQHAPKAPKAYRSKRDTKPPVEGKWVSIPKQRDLTRTEPRRLTLDETAPPGCLTSQAAAVLMIFCIIAILSAYVLTLVLRTMN